MKWYCKKVKGKWRVYLHGEFSSTGEDVCYGSAVRKDTAKDVVKRLNNPTHDYWKEDQTSEKSEKG